MKLEVGATGKLVQGSIFDEPKAAFERKLRRYDALLYVRWNPLKRQGMGCWEVRRRPEKKSFVHMATHAGANIFLLQYKEADLVHHVLDADVLDDRIMLRLWASDLDRVVPRHVGEDPLAYMQRVHAEMDYRQIKREQRMQDAMDQDQKLMAREQRTAARDMMNLILSGWNPARIAQYWGRAT
jgi:hypothetical protein